MFKPSHLTTHSIYACKIVSVSEERPSFDSKGSTYNTDYGELTSFGHECRPLRIRLACTLILDDLGILRLTDRSQNSGKIH